MLAHPTAAEPDAFTFRVQPLFAFPEKFSRCRHVFFFEITIGKIGHF